VSNPPAPAVKPSRRRLLILIAILVAATIVFGVLALNKFRSDRAFTSAPVCPAGTTSSTSCRLVVPATITKILVYSSRNGTESYKLQLQGPNGVSGTHGFPSGDGVVGMADPGDKVDAEVWRGQVVAVNNGVFRTLTSDAPIYREREWSSGALTTGVVAVVFVLAWAWRVRSVKGFLLQTNLHGWRAAIYLFFVTAAFAAVSTVLLELAVPDSPEPILLAGFFVLVALLVGWFYWRGTRKLARTPKLTG
jgi:hypothetical protein